MSKDTTTRASRECPAFLKGQEKELKAIAQAESVATSYDVTIQGVIRRAVVEFIRGYKAPDTGTAQPEIPWNGELHTKTKTREAQT